MPRLEKNLIIDRCPHCSLAHPNLFKKSDEVTKDHAGQIERHWFFYSCGGCGGIVIAWAFGSGQEIIEIFPEPQKVDEDIPERPRAFLEQAIASIHAPAGAIMLAASAVDSMLKIKGYKDSTLNERIVQAADDHLITKEMASWAHEVRLDANDQRHADDNALLPTGDDAKRAIEFTKALAEFLFVLPAKVQRGMEQASNK
ncbi:DUF4145 domain-containing protein [Thioalkalivibrio sp. ALJ7]|uniref:DUF4145 domain-containing protein n=1 Tax=Thioalkalivibrio sp. ALJ7 TaxID=1158756 RepID=UPI0009DB278D|nr:DUF4145 domain-containing protein [Thioalkalivibrio sp. ALJ7]